MTAAAIRDWSINPRTGWPWPGIIGRREDSPVLAEARHRAAIRIRVLRVEITYLVTSPAYADGLMTVIRNERLTDARAEIRSLREIFKRPASRPGRPDLAGLLGAASRDEGAQIRTSDATSGSLRPGPIAVCPGGDRDLSAP